MGVCDWSAQSVTVKTAENKLTLKIDKGSGFAEAKGWWLSLPIFHPALEKEVSWKAPWHCSILENLLFPRLCFYLIIELRALVVMQHSSICICGQQRAPGFAIYALETQVKSWIRAPASLNQLAKLHQWSWKLSAFVLPCSAWLRQNTQQWPVMLTHL